MRIRTIAFTVPGLIALGLVIWFVGPLAGYGTVYPLEGALARLLLILAIWAIAGTVFGVRWMLRRKRAAAVEQSITEPVADDTPVLREKMQDAMATLKKSSGRSGNAYLYDLPWYIIIGPPGSGKTTALVNSGLKFPLAGPGGARAIAGVGGTRHCDWWFTEEAVMIDTAGRYTTQDSDSETDRRSWTGFLDMLAENRPRQPINGALVCVSVEDLMTLPQAELDAHAAAIRRRLDELQNRLKISFPVYFVLTKMDLVAGFTEFFGDLTPEQRAMVWGMTFRPKGRSDNMVAAFEGEFDELMMALSDQTTDRLQMEPDARARSRIFGFPMQMASLKGPLNDFLIKVFEPSRYQSEAALRGVYFTSGTQEGTPIDRVLGALSRNFGAQGGLAVAFSGQGRSYFLTDLLQRVVFAESGWVSTNIRHIRRNLAMRAGAYAALLLAVVGVGAAWGVSYMRNTALETQVDQAIDEYRELAAGMINEPRVGDGDLHMVVASLDKLRFMPLGYATRDDGVPFGEGFGLAQHERLRAANIDAYHDALDRLFLPRLIYRLEQLLQKNIQDTAFVYEGLKVYLMLGGLATIDDELVQTWMARDWSNLYAGAANAKGRERLMEHLQAALERPSSAVDLNGALVEQAQNTLARMPLADRAYTLMRTRAEAQGYPAWNAADRGGPDAELVFEKREGGPLSDVEVPGFFTYDGFHDGVLAQMDAMVERARNDRWVLGAAGNQSVIEAQFNTIRQDILNRYRVDFIAAWDAQLSRLRIAAIGSGDNLTVMGALAAPTSPLKQLLVSLTNETQLTKLREDAAAAAPGGTGPAGAVQAVAEKKLVQGAASVGGQVGTALALSALDQQGAATGATGPAINYGADIEAHFKPLHDFASAAGGAAPVDGLIARFNNLYQALNLMRAGGAARDQAVQSMQGELSALEADAARMPGLVANMIDGTVKALKDITQGSLKGRLNQALANEVTGPCQQIVENRYPFYNDSSRPVPLADFARLFGPNGIMNTFFQRELASMVDQSGQAWRGRDDTDLSRSLSNQSLRQFQLAADIRDAFFATGGGMPAIEFYVTPVTLSPDAFTVTFDVDGQQLVYDHSAARPARMTWPGPGEGRAEVAVTPEIAGRESRISETGPWGLFRMIRRAAALNQGDSVGVNFNIGGRNASFNVQASSVLNPFTLAALGEFRCPRAL
jgi:type VI secretion system protein ImpL